MKFLYVGVAMSAKKFGFIAVVVFFILLICFSIGLSPNVKNQEKSDGFDKVSSNEAAPAVIQSVNKIGGNNDRVSDSVSNSGVWNPMGDAASSAEIKKWFSDRGNYSFYGPEVLSDYQGYDIETLKRLGDSGDIKALHTMADRANNFEELKLNLWKAAIYGSTSALIQLGASYENNDGSIYNFPIEKQREKILEILSYYEVAQMRGDWWGNITNGPSLIDRFQVELSENDRQIVKKGAEQIYNNLQNRRTEMGLGEFDNSVPDSVIKFYEEMVKPL